VSSDRAIRRWPAAPVGGTRAIPKERVRLDTETVTEERRISEQVRKEQIETEGTET